MNQIRIPLEELRYLTYIILILVTMVNAGFPSSRLSKLRYFDKRLKLMEPVLKWLLILNYSRVRF